MAQFIRTRLATDFNEVLRESFWERVLSFIPRANLNYDPVMHLVASWLVEFPESDDRMPWREIGLDAEGTPVLAGPTDQDYGFWLDTNMKLEDFTDAEKVSEEAFERLWRNFFKEHPDRNPDI